MSYNNIRKKKWRDKNMNKYVCESCDFKHSDLFNYNKHLATNKHKKLTNPNDSLIVKEIKLIIAKMIRKIERESYGDYTENDDGTITLSFY